MTIIYLTFSSVAQIDDCIIRKSNASEKSSDCHYDLASAIEIAEMSSMPDRTTPSKLGVYQRSDFSDDEMTEVDPLDMDIHVDTPSIDGNVFIPEPTLGCDDTNATDMLFSCSTLSRFQATLILISWFSKFPGISKNAFSQLLSILHTKILPENNTLPTSYAEAASVLKSHMTPVQEYHCCTNDCVVFRDSKTHSYKGLCECPVCGESRYKPSTTIPRKTFKYLPVTDRIIKWFGNEQTSYLLQSHKETPMSSNREESIHHCRAWKELYCDEGVFEGEARSLAFALCLDGTNPFSKEKYSYSMCPMLLIPLNLPQNLRKSAASIMLAGIIPGPREAKNTDPYVDVLVDELLALNNTRVYDALRDEYFSLKVSITLNILDYPGQNKLFHSQGTCTKV